MRHWQWILCAVELGLAAGCSAELGDGNQPGQTRQEIDTARVAIFEGLSVGRDSIVTSVNQVLGENLLDASFAAGTAMQPPAPPAATSCPYLEVPAPTDTSLNCRFLVERARDLAYASMGPALDQGPQAAELVDAEDPEWVGQWFQRGAFSGVDGEVVRAVAELRRLGACDSQPTGADSSEMAGYELGRQLFLERLAAQIAVTPPTVCDFDAGIIDPARDAATAQIGARIAARPLCDGFVPTDPTAIFELDRARLAYELGVRAGVSDQAVLSAQDLLATWVCTPPAPEGGGGGGGTGDPLVLDLAGDGIAASAVGVDFDLAGTGVPARVAWPTGDDALLAIDFDGNGVIDDGRELLSNYLVGPGGSRYADGFAALAGFDRAALGGNGDGVIDAGDAIYADLRVWRDADRDGRSTADELVGLAEVGVPELPISPVDGIAARRGGMLVTGRAGMVAEVWFDRRF